MVRLSQSTLAGSPPISFVKNLMNSSKSDLVGNFASMIASVLIYTSSKLIRP
jgi:hypothetical protein